MEQHRRGASRRGLVVGLVVLVGFALVASVAAQEEPLRIIFMHHSTGEGLIFQGGVLEGFRELGYEFWHHGYNSDGLSDRDGNYTYVGWDVPGDNTDPDGWYTIFNQPVTDPPTNVFSHMLQYDVIIFKSCFPASYIYDEEVFEAYRRYYLSIRDVIDRHPDKLFIPWTTPPLVPNSTDPESAARARRWADYLTSDEYLAGHPNIAVFDVFSLWSDEDGYLRQEFRADEWDSHPNEIANQIVGPIFVDFVDQAIRSFWYGEEPPSLPPTPLVLEGVSLPEPAAAEAEHEGGAGEQPLAAGWSAVIDDFEGGDFADRWWTYTEGDMAFECAPEGPGHDSDQALHLTFQNGASTEVYAACGTSGFEGMANWAGTMGLNFFWRADEAGVTATVVLSLAEATFSVDLPVPDGDWTQVSLAWDEWAGAGGIDPTQVVGVSFDFGNWQPGQSGSVWIDDLQLITGGASSAQGYGAAGGSLIDDFEGGDFSDRWWTYTDEGAASFSCAVGEPGYDYTHSLQITFALDPGIYASCGRDIVSTQQWADADGISFMWQADRPGMTFGVMLLVDETPFEVYLVTPGLEWTPVTLTWDMFERAPWASPGGAEVFDPARVAGLTVGVGDWESSQQGTIWIDSIQLAGGSIQE